MMKNKGFTPILILVIILVIVGFVGVYYLGTLQGKLTVVAPTTQAMVENLPPTPIANSSTELKNMYEINLPEGYKIIKSSETEVVYGDDFGDWLTISNRNTVNLDSLNPCGDAPIQSGFCLSPGDGWGQSKDILDMKLDGVVAKSFYVSGGVDNAYHIVQTTENPKIELKMYVAGGQLDYKFGQILSTFKFTD